MGDAVSQVTALHAARAPDAELLENIASGDLSSLGLLFDRYALDVRRFLSRLGVTAGDVDDLAQATFLIVMDAASSFRGDGAARAWLFGLAANVVRRHRRSMARMAAHLAAWAREPREGERPPPPSESLDTHERSVRAAHALARLSPKKREVFVMVTMEGLTAETAADALGIPVGTVWTRLHHARRELRAQLLAESP
jgi:RNA polymerase sigma factor (sigma-70 family)